MRGIPHLAVDEAAEDTLLLGAALGDPKSWTTWLGVTRAAFGLPLDAFQLRAFAKVGGGRRVPTQRVRELWAVAGRRSGKSRLAAVMATYIAAFIDHSSKLAPGEVGYVLVIAPTQKQARLVFNYCSAFLEASPILRQLVKAYTQEEIRLNGNIVIAVHPCSFRSVRGRTLLAVVFDESSFFRDETSALPDLELYTATLPALATSDGMLIGISSPYRKIGLLFAKFRDHFGQDDDTVLVVRGATELFNPTIDLKVIEAARKADPLAALSEWDAEFRTDISALLDDATIDGAIDYQRALELAPRGDLSYFAFADASAGRHDQFCICIGHRVGEGDDGRFVADVVRGCKPPFDPRTVATDYASLAHSYGCTKIVGDNYAGEWVTEAFRSAGISYERSDLPKSQLYLESLPFWMRRAISIPNHPQLIRELRLLERRTHRSGRDSVDHGQGGSDDFANALCGAVRVSGIGKLKAEAMVGIITGYGGSGQIVPYAARQRPVAPRSWTQEPSQVRRLRLPVRPPTDMGPPRGKGSILQGKDR